eukprot:TRINITY_DN2605_c0_g1_i4.p1 TRINITY_DN2605_c0_g1~~TRINITY_DN2605_c0_g1_i4.p1  ORF type:complete len:839 (+),score=93.75 TRINITY_DN2605_c0_g1_i4:119-2635(+)
MPSEQDVDVLRARGSGLASIEDEAPAIEGGWLEDHWEETPSANDETSLHAGLADDATSAGNGGWDTLLSLSRRVFRRDASQGIPATSSLVQALFGAPHPDLTLPSRRSSALVPLLSDVSHSRERLDAMVGNGGDDDDYSRRIECPPAAEVRRASGDEAASDRWQAASSIRGFFRWESQRNTVEPGMSSIEEGISRSGSAGFAEESGPETPNLWDGRSSESLREGNGSFSSGRSSSRATNIPFHRASEQAASRGHAAGTFGRNGLAAWAQALRRSLSQRLGLGFSFRGRAVDGGGGAMSVWRQKVNEVLPVLGVVFMAVACTFLYLVVVDGVWQERRGQFSLSCDISEGKWEYSADYPLYHGSCPYIRDAWNCEKYGLTSTSHLRWRWEPDQCKVPAFEASEFLRAMKNKRIAFAGDQSGANSFDSLICMLAASDERPVMVGFEQSALEPGEEDGHVFETSPIRAGEESMKSDQVETNQTMTGGGGPSSWSSSLSSWAFSWQHHATHGTTVPEASLTPSVISDSWFQRSKLEYKFASQNVTLLFYYSPFLVKASSTSAVNATACQLSKAAVLPTEESLFQNSPPSGQANPSLPDDASIPLSSNRSSLPFPTSPDFIPLSAAVSEVCYPNRVEIDTPDPLWASEAAQFDVLILNSGEGWREEEVERSGFGFFQGGVRQLGLSMEGLVGDWAFPPAMSAVSRWLEDSANFNGMALFRSYSPGHQRRECAGRTMLSSFEKAKLAVMEPGGFERYDDAVHTALFSTHSPTPPVRFLNVSMLMAERGDGHPWMFSPKRPRPDCTSWCLPGVPDAWNELITAMLMEAFGKDNPVRPPAAKVVHVV